MPKVTQLIEPRFWVTQSIILPLCSYPLPALCCPSHVRVRVCALAKRSGVCPAPDPSPAMAAAQLQLMVSSDSEGLE